MARRSSSVSMGRRPISIRTRSTTTARRWSCARIYEGLVGLVGSATDEFEGLVAESWEANEDQSVWTFKIRPGLTFQDGSPCDSAAVKASYERLLAMNRGAVAVFSRFISDPDADDDAGSGDDRLRLRHAAAALPHRAWPRPTVRRSSTPRSPWSTRRTATSATPGCSSTPREPAPAAGNSSRSSRARRSSWSGTRTTGAAGKGTTSSGSSSASSKRSRRCASSSKPATSTSWTASASTTNGSTSCKQVPTLNVDISDSTEVEYFSMTEAGPLASPEARQAMCYAYPYQEVIDGVYRGYASRANSLVAPSVLGYQENGFFFETDLEKAKELLAAAGVAEGTELTLLQATGSNPAMSELFQANLAEIGITLTIEPVDQGTSPASSTATRRPRSGRTSCAGAGGRTTTTPGTSSTRRPPAIPGDRRGPTAGSTATRRSTTLLAEAKDASTLESYTEILDEVQTIITEEDLPVICYVSAEVADGAAGEHRRVRLQPHQPRHLRLLDAVPEGVAGFS